MNLKRLSVNRTKDKTEYTYDRYSHSSFLFIGLVLFFLVNFFLDFRSDELKFDWSDIFLAIFSLLLSFYFLYSTIDTSFNATVVSISKDYISVNESPIPTRIPVRIKLSEVRKIFIKSLMKENDGMNYENHQIVIQLVNNKEYPLFRFIDNLKDAKELEDLLRNNSSNIHT